MEVTNQKQFVLSYALLMYMVVVVLLITLMKMGSNLYRRPLMPRPEGRGRWLLTKNLGSVRHKTG